jgi:hypothetical protein
VTIQNTVAPTTQFSPTLLSASDAQRPRSNRRQSEGLAVVGGGTGQFVCCCCCACAFKQATMALRPMDSARHSEDSGASAQNNPCSVIGFEGF